MKFDGDVCLREKQKKKEGKQNIFGFILKEMMGCNKSSLGCAAGLQSPDWEEPASGVPPTGQACLWPVWPAVRTSNPPPPIPARLFPHTAITSEMYERFGVQSKPCSCQCACERRRMDCTRECNADVRLLMRKRKGACNPEGTPPALARHYFLRRRPRSDPSLCCVTSWSRGAVKEKQSSDDAARSRR